MDVYLHSIIRLIKICKGKGNLRSLSQLQFFDIIYTKVFRSM